MKSIGSRLRSLTRRIDIVDAAEQRIVIALAICALLIVPLMIAVIFAYHFWFANA